jgi:hypothetical protein
LHISNGYYLFADGLLFITNQKIYFYLSLNTFYFAGNNQKI